MRIKSAGCTTITFFAAARPNLLKAANDVTSFAVEPGCDATVNPRSLSVIQPANWFCCCGVRFSMSQSSKDGKGYVAEASTSPVLSSITTTEILLLDNESSLSNDC